MSMSTYVVGIKPPDATWKKMKAIWDSCKAAGVEPPQKVTDYFEDEEPDDAGVIVDFGGYNRATKSAAVKEWEDGDMQNGLEVDLTKLPKDIKRLRFVNSY